MRLYYLWNCLFQYQYPYHHHSVSEIQLEAVPVDHTLNRMEISNPDWNELVAPAVIGVVGRDEGRPVDSSGKTMVDCYGKVRQLGCYLCPLSEKQKGAD